jgi:hypothetical protein
VAEALLKYETLQGRDIDRIMKGERLDKPTVAELLQQEAARPKPTVKSPPPSEETGEEPSGGVMPSPA